MTIKVWDYSREYEADKQEVLTTIQEVLESGQLILGENVKAFEEDPNFQRGTAPNPEEIDQALLKSDTSGYSGYTFEGDPSIYVGSINNPSAETAATTTHEGIHNALDPALTGIGEGVIQGTISDSGSALGDEYNTQEIMTNYLSNQGIIL